MRNWREHVCFFDTEVLPNDWLLCAKHSDGTTTTVSNREPDWAQTLQEFIAGDPLLCGYNVKHYDQYILKAILAGGTPQDVYAVSKAIVVEGKQGWEIDMGYVRLPAMIDLMQDLPTFPSLKAIEGNLHMSIEESSVSFDCTDPTAEQWAEIVEYCWHDVDALIPLYHERKDYLEAKETLALMKGLDVERALGMTNAKLTALFLDARFQEWNDEREYVYPENIERQYIPEKVFEFFDRLPAGEIPLEKLFGKEGEPDENGKIVRSRNPYKSLAITMLDCPHVVGWGGLHGARDTVVYRSTATHAIVNVDVTSYYPSLMIKNGYVSRNVPDSSLFEQVFQQRVEAKARGDKKTADALKLVLNTTYGASNNQYNHLYDPLMAHSVCISGQLYLIQLEHQIAEAIPDAILIQANTDGLMFYVARNHLATFASVIRQWEQSTGFTMEQTEVQKIVQRDVNNYVMRDDKDTVKVKGGVVSDFDGGSFKHRSLVVVCRATVNYLLDGIDPAKTITECANPFDFQMVVKAGGSYDKVVHATANGDVEVNRTNRIYAGTDTSMGSVYKMKWAEKIRRDKVANCPEHAIVDNSGTVSIDKIDRNWYIQYAIKQIEAYEGKKPQRRKRVKIDKDNELEVVIEDETPRDALEKVTVKTRTRKSKEEPTIETPTAPSIPSFKTKMYQLAQDIVDSSRKFVKDGYNASQSYEYVKAQQYKTMLRDNCLKNRLMYKLDDMMCNVSPDTLKSDKMVLTQYHAQLTIYDVDSDERQSYLLWSQGSDNLDKGLSKAKTLAIKDFVKANFGISDNEDDPEADATQTASTPQGRKFVSDSDKKQLVKELTALVADKADEATVAKIVAGVNAIRVASNAPTYGEAVLEEIKNPITPARATVLLTKLSTRGSAYGLEI